MHSMELHFDIGTFETSGSFFFFLNKVFPMYILFSE